MNKKRGANMEIFPQKTNTNALLRVNNIALSFIQYTSGLKQKQLNIISNLSLEAYSGEILAVVGSSGSGKSLLAHSILGILPSNAKLTGEMYYQNEILTQEKKEQLRGKKIALIPQSTNFLDPLMKISSQVLGTVNGNNKTMMIKKQQDIFQKYGLRKEVEKMYPHELSGGMTRRVLIATALLYNANLIIADEPTPGLDEIRLEETLKYFKDMANKGSSVILITHDIEAALKIADKIAIFYAGSILEIANVQDFKNEGEELRHPYTTALWNALPQNKFESIEGHQPIQDEIQVMDRCIFYERCPIKIDKCMNKIPALLKIRGGLVRCKNVS